MDHSADGAAVLVELVTRTPDGALELATFRGRLTRGHFLERVHVLIDGLVVVAIPVGLDASSPGT